MSQTPGPWTIEEYTGTDTKYIYGGDHQFVGETHGKNAKDNAYLIVASPDLLAAAKACYEEWWLEGCPIVHEPDNPCWLDLMGSAIAKAGGG